MIADQHVLVADSGGDVFLQFSQHAVFQDNRGHADDSEAVWRSKVPMCSLLTVTTTTIHSAGSRVVSVLDSGAVGPGFKSQLRHLSVNSLMQTVHTRRPSVHQAAKLVAALLRVARVTVGLVESNGSLPPGSWLASPAGWLPRTGISSGTLRSAIEYGLPLPFTLHCNFWYVTRHVLRTVQDRDITTTGHWYEVTCSL